MFIFIYNTLVLDVKRIDFEARMIDTLRSSSRVLFFFFSYCSSICAFSLFSHFYPIYIRYAATNDGQLQRAMYRTLHVRC